MEEAIIRRRDQIIHLQHTLSELPDLAGLTFSEVRQLVVDKGLIAPGIDVDRYVAMILSYTRANTTDEDVRWHIL